MASAPDRLHGGGPRATSPQSPYCRPRNQARVESRPARVFRARLHHRSGIRSRSGAGVLPRRDHDPRATSVPAPDRCPRRHPHRERVSSPRTRAPTRRRHYREASTSRVDAARDKKRRSGGAVGPRRYRGGSGSMSEGGTDANGPRFDSRFPIPDSLFPIPDSRFVIPDSRFPTRSGRAWLRAARLGCGPRHPVFRRWH